MLLRSRATKYIYYIYSIIIREKRFLRLKRKRTSGRARECAAENTCKKEIKNKNVKNVSTPYSRVIWVPSNYIIYIVRACVCLVTFNRLAISLIRDRTRGL